MRSHCECVKKMTRRIQLELLWKSWWWFLIMRHFGDDKWKSLMKSQPKCSKCRCLGVNWGKLEWVEGMKTLEGIILVNRFHRFNWWKKELKILHAWRDKFKAFWKIRKSTSTKSHKTFHLNRIAQGQTNITNLLDNNCQVMRLVDHVEFHS